MSSLNAPNMSAPPVEEPDRASTQSDTLTALRRFTRSRPPMERCELCAAALPEIHQHLLERTSRQIACACDGCAILFSGQEGGKYLRVPRRVRQLRDFVLTDLQWEEMMLPINLAFFFRNAGGQMTAMYPSPAGAMESLLTLRSWEEHMDSTGALRKMEPEVEALIVNRVGTDAAYFIVPIDECYRLVGLIRTKWRGLSGGADVWTAITEFFQELQQKANGKMEVRHA
jgi:hypothetical protein